MNEAHERDAEKVCDVPDCNAWKSGEFDYCHHHKGLQSGRAGEGNQRAMKTGVHSDPVNLFDWLAENEETGLAYILNKLFQYSQRAPHPVFEVDVRQEDIECFDDAEAALTAYGDDLLLMCIRDYVRWRGSKKQIEEGLTTMQMKEGEHGTFKVEDSNPVNLDLDRLDGTTMRQKDKLGLLPSPDSQQAQGVIDMGSKIAEALEED